MSEITNLWFGYNFWLNTIEKNGRNHTFAAR